MDRNDATPKSLLKDALSYAKDARETLADFARSIGYSAVQAPLEGLSQVINHVSGKELVPHLDLVNTPRHAQFGSLNWHLQQVGGAIGLVLPFGLVNKGMKGIGALTGRLARFASLTETLSSPIIKATVPVLEAGSSGAVFEGLLRPVQANEGEFWQARFNNAAAGALTFGTLQSTSLGLKGLSTWQHAATSPWLINCTERDIARHLLAGGIAGLVDAETRSLLSGKGLASLSNLGQSAYGFMWVGGALRGSKWLADTANRRSSAADLIAHDPQVKEVISDSPTAKALVAALGDARVDITSGTKPLSSQPAWLAEPQVKDSLIGEPIVKISQGTYGQANPILRGQLLVESLAKIEIALKNPLTLRHVLSESAYAGMMTSRAKNAAARDLNFVTELESKRGEDNLKEARERATSRWSIAAEGQSIQSQARTEHQSKFSPWLRQFTNFGLLSALTARIADKAKDKEHLLELKEFDAKSKTEEARNTYKEDMGRIGKNKAGILQDSSHPNANLVEIAKNEKLDRVIDLIPDSAQVVVDMGAGGGQFAKAIKARRPNAEVIALDLSGKMVADLIADRQNLPIDYRIEHGDAMLPDFPAQSVDVITGNSHTHEVVSYPDIGLGHYRIEHVTAMLENYARMLKPRGRLLIQDFIVPQYGAYTGDFRISFKTPEAGAYFNRWTCDLTRPAAELNLEHTKPLPDFVTVAESQAQLLGTVQSSAKGVGEFLISAMYGMRMREFGWDKDEPWEHQGVLQEQFANLTSADFLSHVQASAPNGYRMVPIRANTYTSPDYIEHWMKHFQIETKDSYGCWTPIDDMSNFHTRIVLGAQKMTFTPPGLETLLPPLARTGIPTSIRPASTSLYTLLSPNAFIAPRVPPMYAPADSVQQNKKKHPNKL